MISYYIFTLIVTLLAYGVMRFFKTKFTVNEKRIYLYFLIWVFFVSLIFPAVSNLTDPVIVSLITLIVIIVGGTLILKKYSVENDENDKDLPVLVEEDDDYYPFITDSTFERAFKKHEIEKSTKKEEEKRVTVFAVKPTEEAIVSEVKEESGGEEEKEEINNAGKEEKITDPQETEQKTDYNDTAEKDLISENDEPQDWIKPEDVEINPEKEDESPEEKIIIEKKEPALKETEEIATETVDKTVEELDDEDDKSSDEEIKAETADIQNVLFGRESEETNDDIILNEPLEETDNKEEETEPEDEIELTDDSDKELSDQDISADSDKELNAEEKDEPVNEKEVTSWSDFIKYLPETVDDDKKNILSSLIEGSLSVDELIDSSIESQNGKDDSKAEEFLLAAFAKTDDINVKTMVCANLVKIYKESGKYLEAREFIKNFIEQEKAELDEGMLKHYNALFDYIDTLYNSLKKSGQSDLPFSRVPKIIKLMAEKKLKKK